MRWAYAFPSPSVSHRALLVAVHTLQLGFCGVIVRVPSPPLEGTVTVDGSTVTAHVPTGRFWSATISGAVKPRGYTRISSSTPAKWPSSMAPAEPIHIDAVVTGRLPVREVDATSRTGSLPVTTASKWIGSAG